MQIVELRSIVQVERVGGVERMSVCDLGCVCLSVSGDGGEGKGRTDEWLRPTLGVCV